MKKKVILTLAGSYEQGMSANLRILEEMGASERETLRVFGQLPPAKNLIQVFQKWQTSYRRQINAPLRMKFIDAQVTQVSCQEMSTQLCYEFNKWLNSQHDKWQKIRDRLQQNLSKTDEIVLIIETEDCQVQQLPWQLWKLITDDYPQAEVALSTPDYQLPTVASSATNKVKILGVLGNAEGIDIQSDRITLESLPNTEVCFLVEPKHQELTEQLWRSQGWDILFFAGHSVSPANGSTGIIYLNQNEQPLTISQLKYALVKAIQKGLKLAIFNSCDGLGIARDLAELNIPQIIVMREPVPDLVAQEFLKYFLQYFAGGKSFHLAVRLAREKLQGLEAQFPCASWLPVIFQNSAQMPLSWQEIPGGKHHHLTLLTKRSWSKVLLTSVLATSLIIVARYLGVFESLELQTFDHLLRLRPQEQPDPRLLVVAVTENDLHLPQQHQRKGSLSDLALNQLLQKLEQSKPLAIGLDIYRDFPVDSKHKGLAARMRHNQSLIAVCKVSSSDDPGVAPPPEISPERLGFSDFIPDSDGILRRQIVMMGSDPASPCTAPYAFSTQLAFGYLAAKGIIPKYTADEVLQLGSTLIKPWSAHTGGYQAADLSGYQVMLNYRSFQSPKNVAPIVTLEQVLNNKVNPNAIKDRIVLIGTVANSYQDYWLSPYSRTQKSTQELSGVIVQAQMTSQIISAVLDKRPLLWASPFWGDIIWVLSCSLVGGVLAMQLKSPISLLLAIAVAQVCLYALSYGLLLHNGYWVPLLPSALALLAISSSVVSYTHFPAKRQQYTEL